MIEVRSRWACLGVVVVVAIGLVARESRADEVTWLPGNSREISRTTSASRDAAVSGLVFGPRVGAKGAADFALVKIPIDGIALRPGFFGFFDLEHEDPGLSGALPLPGEGKGPMLWRGMFGFSLMLSAERLARAWLGPHGTLELGATLGHESDHVTGQSSINDAPRPGDILAGGGGDFVIYEIAMRKPLGRHVDGWARIEDRAYFRGPILHAPGVEAGLRWHLAPHLEPVLSVFGEGLLVNHDLTPEQIQEALGVAGVHNSANNGGFAGLLAGLSVPGFLGEVLPYTAADIGNGKGLLINHREFTLSIGVRYAPF